MVKQVDVRPGLVGIRRANSGIAVASPAACVMTQLPRIGGYGTAIPGTAGWLLSTASIATIVVALWPR